MKPLLSRIIDVSEDVGADIIRPQKMQNPVGADIIRPKVLLSEYGIIVNKAINEIPEHYDGVYVDRFVIMPNHIHIILRFDYDGGRMVSAPTVIGSFKRYVSKQIGYSIWQKGFYDHVIRDDEDYLVRAQYIDENPKKWLLGKDEYYA